MGIVQQRSFSVTADSGAVALEGGLAGRQSRPAPLWCCTMSPNCAGSSACARILSPTFRTNSRRRSPPSRDSPKPCSPALWTIPATIAASSKSSAITPRAWRVLTDDLLKLARIEAGKLEVQFVPGRSSRN